MALKWIEKEYIRKDGKEVHSRGFQRYYDEDEKREAEFRDEIRRMRDYYGAMAMQLTRMCDIMDAYDEYRKTEEW